MQFSNPRKISYHGQPNTREYELRKRLRELSNTREYNCTETCLNYPIHASIAALTPA